MGILWKTPWGREAPFPGRRLSRGLPLLARWFGLGLLALGGLALGQGTGSEPLAPGSLGPRAVLARCREEVRGLRPLGLYRGEEGLLVLLGQERPLLLLALEAGRPRPHVGPPRGRPVGQRPLAFLRELTLARRVAVVEGEYRCFVLYRGRVVGVLRLGMDLEPLPVPGVSPAP